MKRKRKMPPVPCTWKVDGEWWCAVKTRSTGNYIFPIGHGLTPGAAIAHWKSLMELKREKDKAEVCYEHG